MVTVIAYYVALIATVVYLAMAGGRTGLWGGSCLVVTSVLTLLTVLPHPYYDRSLPLYFAVDIVSLGWKTALACVSTRKWPIWVAAFQLNLVAAHLAVIIAPHIKGQLYYAMLTVWAIPTLLVMVIGTMLDNRFEKRTNR